jgi:hypothetical protein
MCQQHRSLLLLPHLSRRQLPTPQPCERLLLLQPLQCNVAGCCLLPCCCLLLQQLLHSLASPEPPAVQVR